MFVDDDTRLRHMRDSAQTAIRFAQGRTRRDLETDDMLKLSLVKCIEIVGEAASKITSERQSELSQIPWAKIVGMRNRLVYGYFEIDLDVVWDTVTQALPELLSELNPVLESKED